jgi:CubicO group peptidase (beta-lactamase class C family)
MPGQTFGYSGEGYVYLQQVVERLTGEPLHEYLQRTVLAPLGMTHSSYVWRTSYTSTAATGHTSDGTPYPKDRPDTANAAASLHTTPQDFARFLDHILNASDHQPNAIDADVAAMLAPQVHVAGNLWWGLGWGLLTEAHDEIIWHWGDNPGFTNFTAARRQERSGVVIMTNSDNGLRAWDAITQSVLGLNEEVFDWLAQSFCGAQQLEDVKTRCP